MTTDLRRHHPRRRPQRPHPAGLSRQGRPQDAGDRAPAGRRRRTAHAGRPAPSRLPAQHPRLLPARHHRDAVVRAISSSSGTARATSSPSSMSRCSPATAARWNGGPTSNATIASFAHFSRRDADTLRRWHDEFVPIVRDILAPESRSPPLPPQERRALLERSARRPAPARGERALAAGIRRSRSSSIRRCKAGLLFFNGLREVDLRVRGLRPSHRGAAGEPGQGADVARRHRRRSRARWKRRCARAAATSG